jgi:hypothetical protein
MLAAPIASMVLRCYIYLMATRTTLMLDPESRKAARELALRYGCSTSEAIRRAVIRQRDAAFGVPAAGRKERVAALKRLFELFEGNDADDEIQRLKSQDAGF